MWWTCSVTRRKDVKQPADSCQFGAPIILVPLRFCPVSNENPTTSCCLASWMTTTKHSSIVGSLLYIVVASMVCGYGFDDPLSCRVQGDWWANRGFYQSEPILECSANISSMGRMVA